MKIAKDKILHLVAGAVVAFVVILVSRTPALGFLAAVIAGVGKELWDKRENDRAARKHVVPPHTVEWQDAVWTAGGGALVAALTHFGGL
jgi:hypothetical protein